MEAIQCNGHELRRLLGPCGKGGIEGAGRHGLLGEPADELDGRGGNRRAAGDHRSRAERGLRRVASRARAAGRRVPAAAEEQLEDHETPKLRRRLLWSLGFLLVLMYFSMGHMMWGWPLPSFYDGNHVAMGLTQLLLTVIIMVINQKFFISGFKALLAPRAEHGYARGARARRPRSCYSTYALFAMTGAQVRGDDARGHALYDGLLL